MKFRFQRDTLEESMETAVEVNSIRDLTQLIASWACTSGIQPRGENFILTSEPHCYDERVGWRTHVVLLDRQAVGFMDGPIEKLEGVNRSIQFVHYPGATDDGV